MMMMNATMLAWFGLPGGAEVIIVLVVALLIFGRKLPDVARSVGRSIVEFKKGVRDIKDDVNQQSQLPNPPPQNQIDQSPPPTPAPPQRDTTADDNAP